MVEINSDKIFKCPYCDKKFHDRDDADDHISDCVDIECAIESWEETYICQYCHEVFEIKQEAENCERRHAELKDDLYENFIQEREAEKLLKAGSHPNQKKLGGYEDA